MINTLFITLAMASTAFSAPHLARRDDCQNAYTACIAAGTPQVACSCTLTACVGEDNARNREFCASATANLPKPTSTGIPGGCNPAHPGSCPSTTTSLSQPTSTGIPGGCNPAHPGSCPSTYFTYTTATVTPTPAPAPAPTQGSGAPTGYTDPKPVAGKKWAIKDLTRYCGEGNTGCDYNFKIEADGKTEACTVIRMPGSNAASESWSNQPCTSGSPYKVSWGYVAQPAPAFAVITVVKDKELAWFGASNINGQAVSPSNPFGSGQFGNLGPEQVYTY